MNATLSLPIHSSPKYTDFSALIIMASSSPQPSPQQLAAMQQQVQQQMSIEAQKRGMTPQQFQAWQRQQIEADARKAGMSVDQYINQLKKQAIENHQRQQQQQIAQQQQQESGQPHIHEHEHQHQGQSGQQVSIAPGPPDPKGLAVAKWLRNQDLKTRTCILNGQRKDMFRGEFLTVLQSILPDLHHLNALPKSNGPFVPSSLLATLPLSPKTLFSLL